MIHENITEVISQFFEEDITRQIAEIRVSGIDRKSGEIVLQKHAKTIRDQGGKLFCITKKECHVNFTSSG